MAVEQPFKNEPVRPLQNDGANSEVAESFSIALHQVLDWSFGLPAIYVFLLSSILASATYAAQDLRFEPYDYDYQGQRIHAELGRLSVPERHSVLGIQFILDLGARRKLHQTATGRLLVVSMAAQ